MRYYDVFDAEKNKLETLLAENNLVCEFHAKNYPIALTISPDASPAAQMELFAVSDDGATSRDARLVFTFPVGEIGVKVVGRLVMTDALMNKIKGAAKKLHKAYVEAFFAEHMEANRSTGYVDDTTDTGDVSTSDFSDFFEDDEDET